MRLRMSFKLFCVLFLLIVSQSLSAAVISCSDFGFTSAPDKITDYGGRCWVHTQSDDPAGNKDIVVTPNSWGREPNAGKRGLISETFEALSKTRRVLEPYGLQNSGPDSFRVIFVLSDALLEDASGTPTTEGAAEYINFPGDQCYLQAGRMAWRAPGTPSESESRATRRIFRHVVAHEFAHCWFRKFSNHISTADAWWDEGGAEFVGALVYPELDGEHGSAAYFDLNEPMFQPYDSVVFFQHYANTNNNGATFDLIRTIARRGTLRNQKLYLMGLPSFNEFLHNTLVTHFKMKVRDPGGGHLPRGVPINYVDETLNTSGGSVRVEHFQSYLLKALKMALPPGYRYTLNPPSSSHPGAASIWKYPGTTSRDSIQRWTTPVTILGDCEESTEAMVFFSHPRHGTNSFSVSYTTEEIPEEQCSCSSGMNQCLAGTWSLDTSSAQAAMERRITGTLNVEFKEDALFEAQYSFRSHSRRDGDVLSTHQGTATACAKVLGGSSEGEESEGVFLFQNIALHGDNDHKRSAGDRGWEAIPEWQVMSVATLTYEYTCKGNDLMIWDELRFRRTNIPTKADEDKG